MIINIWSTPRTGSVWYSFYQQSLHPNSVYLSEIFNRYHMDIYHTVEQGKRLNLRSYVDGSFYTEYTLVNGVITGTPVYKERTRSINDEENYRISLFDQASKDKTLIVHNHVWPMSEVIKKKLVEIGEKNIYTYRKDMRAQLGSYAIALATKQFVQFNTESNTNIVDDVDVDLLKKLIYRIQVWDEMTSKISDDKSTIVAYEDIQFFDTEKFPKKQNVDYRKRLSTKMLDVIDELVDKYEKDKRTNKIQK